mmetsp:Transcript_33102/g.105542  ORF Transcript_33102/g.105542 Transcript_33102/m.105542 type:complete len:204 (-) Transcript_33102:103-714(-)
MHQLEHVRQPVAHGLAPDHKLVHHAVRRTDGPTVADGLLQLGANVDASSARSDPPLQCGGIQLRSARLREQRGVEREQRQLRDGQPLQVEQHVGVHHAGARQRVGEQRHAARERRHVGGHLLDLGLEVGQAHPRDGCEVLGAVLRELRALQVGGRADHIGQLLLAHRRLGRLQPGPLLGRPLLGQRRVRHHLDGREVAVVDEQ